MKLTERQLEDLVVAVLPVNSYALDRAWALLPGLDEQRLLDVEWVRQAKHKELVRRLKAAGYARGRITEIVAPRLAALMEDVRIGGGDALGGVVEANDRGTAETLLTAILGDGPPVAGTAWMFLRSSASSEGTVT